MSEVSLLHKLEQQKEKNLEAYQSLFNSLNLSRMDRYDQLSETSQTNYQTLRQAGFAPESIVDDLGKISLKLLIQFGKNNPEKLYLEDDIKAVAQTYGLKFLSTSYFKGKHKDSFLDDLNAFQQNQSLIHKNNYLESPLSSYDYRLLGPSRSFDDHNHEVLKPPLLFYNVGKGIYYLVSNYDNWVNEVRKVVYWPLASFNRTLIYLVILVSTFCALYLLFDSKIFLLASILFTLVQLFFMPLVILCDWDRPNTFPSWFKKTIYSLVPY
ncbi:hypothetical protein WJR50_21605 [Catalinimonas sp. 4WD22]|uniref:hypothetical protein n=1 Tax=Catalinimonas locisalis TaxID=3133978 RepID=UPI0031012A4A